MIMDDINMHYGFGGKQHQPKQPKSKRWLLYLLAFLGWIAALAIAAYGWAPTEIFIKDGQSMTVSNHMAIAASIRVGTNDSIGVLKIERGGTVIASTVQVQGSPASRLLLTSGTLATSRCTPRAWRRRGRRTRRQSSRSQAGRS